MRNHVDLSAMFFAAPVVVASIACVMASPCMAAQPVTTSSLLREMIDREGLARFPSPAHVCAQFSSYDRASTTPDDHATWFANADAGHFLREEKREDRTEHVLMDAAGPGAVVRIWSANPAGTLRVYLDGAETPAIEVSMADLLSGRAVIGGVAIAPPLAAVKARGWNLFLPIPYATRCVITSDRGGFYYHVNHRTYVEGTDVETFTPSTLDGGLVQEVIRVLSGPHEAPAPGAALIEGTITPGRSRDAMLNGSGAVRAIRLTVHSGEEDETALADVLQTLVLELAFDGVTTAWVPAGDFFGSGVGASAFEDWMRTVGRTSEGHPRFECRWVMPYRESARILLRNLGESAVRVRLEAVVGAWSWDERSMLFHSTWRREHPLPTRPMRDWNYVEIKGQGVYAGDSLAVVNPVAEWWGEGDEKIYVDGETFPSHFGTGTEDYYGYAWCSNEPFAAPFHAQPRCDGHAHGNNWGHSTVSRVRALDAIAFTTGLRMDMEVWHWKECEVSYAATTYFYARPGATHNREPSPHEVARGVIHPPPLPPPFAIAGAIECETMEIVGKTPDRPAERQLMTGFARETWSGDAQLWFRGRQPGDFVELRFAAPARDAGDPPGPWRIVLHATRSWDYGIVRFSVNGQPAGAPIDLFSGRHGLCTTTGPIDLGVFVPVDGSFTLRAEVVGGNEEAFGTRAFVGLDCVVLTEP